MKITNDQYEISQILFRRAQGILGDKNQSCMDKECDRFFYWIMSQIAEEMVKNPGQDTYELQLEVVTGSSFNAEVIYKTFVYMDRNNCVRTKRNPNEYVPCYIWEKRQFEEVVREVKEAINKLPGFKAYYYGWLPGELSIIMSKLKE